MSSQTATLAAIRAFGLTARCTEGEYRVAFTGRDSEASAYYTGDAADAIATARAMATRRDAVLAPLVRWITVGHCGSYHAHVTPDGRICIGIPATEGDGAHSTCLEYVRTYAEARVALGY